MDRRRFIVVAGGLVLLRSSLGAAAPRNPFSLGVASGCPRDTSVVLWTRLAPEPLAGGGMPNATVPLRWRLCADASMQQAVREGVVRVGPDEAHSAHVHVAGLQPGREYWYQFHYGEDDSPVGRTRTADPRATQLRLAVANCQHYESGFYAAYADIAAWAPDCVVHIGDYIYESAPTPPGAQRSQRYVRQHAGAEAATLWGYRNRYAQYRGDPQLQAAHAAAPWIAAFDDHEVNNNWAGSVPADPERQTPLEFAVRKQAAFRAYYEHMPLERPPRIAGTQAELQLYDRFDWGPARIHLLDTRQYRDDQACGDGFLDPAGCREWQDPRRSLTGAAQERWLEQGLLASKRPFNLIAQQTWFAPFRFALNGRPNVRSMDAWDGYPVQRARLAKLLRRVRNPVVFSGDLHAAGAHRLRERPGDPDSALVGYEFSATSISSHCGFVTALPASLPDNPDTLHASGEKRGYVRATVTDADVHAEFRSVVDAFDAGSAVFTEREFHTRERP
jgi:alkaline phosphatase D